jgi:DNA polymerase delta subunit 3
MLFEFHRQQNGKKPHSVHATYLVAGRKRKVDPRPIIKTDGEDDYMQSSPLQSSPPGLPEEALEDISVLSVTLVREEDMGGVSYVGSVFCSG